MFQIIFIFSDWILIKQIIFFSTLFVLGETNFQKILPGVFEWGNGVWLKLHRIDVFSRNVNTINWKNFPTHGGENRENKSNRKLNKHSGQK